MTIMEKRRTIGGVCKSIAEATNLAIGCNLKVGGHSA
jgi:hypothetical protein